MGDLTLDPVVIGPSQDDEERRRAREEALRILAESGATDAIRRELGGESAPPAAAPPERDPEPPVRQLAPVEMEGGRSEALRDLGTLAPVEMSGGQSESLRDLRPAPTLPEQAPIPMQGEAQQAQAIGDAYRSVVGERPEGLPEGARNIHEYPGGRTYSLPPGTMPGPGGTVVPDTITPQPTQLRSDASAAGSPPAPAPTAPPGNTTAPGGAPLPPPEQPPSQDMQSLQAAMTHAEQGHEPQRDYDALRAEITGRPMPQLPQERDHTGADVADGFRRFLHAIAGGLAGWSGRRIGEFRSLGEQEREQDAERIRRATLQRQLESRQRAESLGRIDDAEDRDLRRSELQARREGQEADRAHRAEVDAERLEQGRRRVAAYEMMQEAQRRRYSSEADYAEALRDPNTPASRMAREGLLATLALYPDAARERFLRNQRADQIDLDSLPGEEARRLQGQIAGGMRDLTSRHNQPRRGGAGGGGQAIRQRREALATPPAGWRGTEAQWQAMPLDDRVTAARQLGTRSTRGSRPEGGVEIMPGVVATTSSVGAPEARSMRAGLAQARSGVANLRSILDVGRRYGTSGVIDPRAAAEIEASLTLARGMVAQLGRMGVINEGEVPRINAALPNPTNLQQMTFGTLRSRVGAWEDRLVQDARSQLEVAGVDPEGVQRAIRYLRSGETSPSGDRERGAGERSQSQQPNFTITGPDGSSRPVFIHPSRVEDAQRIAAERGDTLSPIGGR